MSTPVVTSNELVLAKSSSLRILPARPAGAEVLERDLARPCMSSAAPHLSLQRGERGALRVPQHSPGSGFESHERVLRVLAGSADRLMGPDLRGQQGQRPKPTAPIEVDGR